MFCDLVGSTALSARLDPEDLREVIGAYHRCVAETVGRYDGFVAKYMGDGVLVYFGYPQAHEDDAVRAIYTGLAVTRAVKQLGKRMLQAQGGRLRARVGIATGLVVVGDLVGAQGSEEDAVTGETPNLAARLQEMAGSGRVAVAERTRILAGDAFNYEAPEERALKGFPGPVRLWRVLGPSGAQSRFVALHGRWLTPMVGREHEMGLLLERWRQAKEGEGQVVMVMGEAGIGKSRLTEVLYERIQADGPIRVRLQCSPYHTNSALHPVIEHLERAARFEPEDPPSTRLEKVEALIGQAVPATPETVSLLASLLSVPTEARYPPLSMTPERQKERTLAALTEQLVGLSAKKPLLVVLEDAHWIDQTTLEWIDLTVAEAERARMLVVITSRPEFEPSWLGRPHATLLTLNRLSRRQGTEMVGEVAGGRALPPEVLEQVVARTDGVPLFVEELTRMVLESGLLEEESDRYVLKGPLPPLAIPATLQDSLMARLDRLAPAKQVAQTAAAIGRTFRHDLLMAVAGLEEAKLIEALGQLNDAGLVFRQGAPPTAIYTFKHALLQRAAYESLLKSQRQRLHARIATMLEEQFPEVAESAPEVIGQHYGEAGLAEPAIEWWCRAGQRAVARSTGVEAIAILGKALDLLDSQSDRVRLRDRELDILTALGSALISTKGYTAEETERIYRRAQALLENIGESARAFPILYGMWSFFVWAGNLRESWKVTEKFERLVEKLNDTEFRSTNAAMWGCEYWNRGRFSQSVQWFTKAVADFDRDRDKQVAISTGEHPASISLSGGCWSQWTLGYPEKALEWISRADQIAEDSTHSNSIAIAKFHKAYLLYERGNMEEARACVEDFIGYSVEQVVASWYGGGLIVKGACRVKQGSHAEGVALIGDGLGVWKKIGGGYAVPLFLSILAEACWVAGRPDDGMRAIEEGLKFASESGQHQATSALYRLQGELLLVSGRNSMEEVEGAYLQALSVAREQEAKSYELRAAMSLARLWAEGGERQRAHDLLAPVYGWFTEGFDTADLKDAKALLDELSS